MLNSDFLCLNKPENEKKLEWLCTTDVFPGGHYKGSTVSSVPIYVARRARATIV